MKHVPWASALLLGMVAGVFVAVIPGISIQKTIDLDGLASLFIGLILFCALNLIYQRKSAVVSGEKAILVKLAQDLFAAADMLDASFSRCYRQDPLERTAVEEIYAGIQRYNNTLYTLTRAVEGCSPSGVRLEPLQSNREAYRALLTDSPFPIRYNVGALREQQRYQRVIREALTDVILALNRY